MDASPVPTALRKMQVAGVHTSTPRLEEFLQGPVGFAGAWWSPQPGLKSPPLIAHHPATGCAVVADARLDEPEELRHLLGLDATDPKASAAQLILQAWLRWQDGCVEHIDGDFAFAIRDPRRNALFLARDRMAGRPLYVHHQPGRLLVFGSSAHAVLAHPQVPRDRNEARIADFLVEGLEGVDMTSTFHLAVERHPSAHTLLVTPQHQQLRRYWKLQPGQSGPLPRDDDEWAEALTNAMERAVRQRLAGPGHVGSMLSGGLDSTTLAIIAGEQLHAAGRAALPTFSSIDSSLPDCNETRAIRMLAGLTLFTPTLIDRAHLGARLPALDQFLDRFDEPFDANMTLIDAQYVAAAESGVDTVLDGIDGDTLFSAGGTLQRQLRTGHWSGALGNLRGMGQGRSGSFMKLLLPEVRAAVMPTWVRKALWPVRGRQRHEQFLKRSLISRAFALEADVRGRLERLRAHRSMSPYAGPEMEAAEAIQHPYLVVAMERYGRVGSRHGVTAAHPFTERRLLELCVNLPDRQRLRDGWSKPVLRHAMRGRMPEAVRWRNDKQHLGWSLAQTVWNGRGEQLEEVLQSQRPMLAAYIDLSALDTATMEYRESANSIALGRMLYAARLAIWLSKDTLSATESRSDA